MVAESKYKSSDGYVVEQEREENWPLNPIMVRGDMSRDGGVGNAILCFSQRSTVRRKSLKKIRSGVYSRNFSSIEQKA